MMPIGSKMTAIQKSRFVSISDLISRPPSRQDQEADSNNC